ncbi:MAG: endonuclease/exonuclease/phosphatase family protein [Pedobacter sp.]|nr:MAG: endonuclease/exonuclease/phosphatase family protein [Pedobacter sp.]
MRILTWNVERPALNSNRLPAIIENVKSYDADIVVLTETSNNIPLGPQYHIFQTIQPVGDYKEEEIRVCIYSKFRAIERLETYDPSVSVCVLLDTPFGELAVYGTIIGILGNRSREFDTALASQIEDLDRIARTHKLCVAGDLNTSFSDNFYFTHQGRNALQESFRRWNLVNVTRSVENNIDHIVISQDIIRSVGDINLWNQDFKLSDHIGLAVDIENIG